MIPYDTVQKIKEAAQIAEVIGDFVSLKKKGADYKACCPFHNEKTPSFSVSVSKGLYKCFGCGKSGNAVTFLMDHENMTYLEALKYLANKYHIEVVEKEETAEEIQARQKTESLHLVMDFAEKFFQDSLNTDEGRSIGYAYFKRRGLEDETIRKYGLGWSPSSGKALVDKALAQGYKEEYLDEVNLIGRRDDGSIYDKYRERVMFPIHSLSGRVIAFAGRTLKQNHGGTKYVNSSTTPLYEKRYTLYGIYFAKNEISRKDKCYLVEGYLDVLSMHQLGITNVVASSGTALTEEQVRLIKKFTRNVTIMYDGDNAGINAALKGIGILLKEDMNVNVVLIPDGDDPDSYAQKHTLEEVTNFIAANERNFISFKIDRLMSAAGDDPIRKGDAINEISDTVALIPDPVKRATCVQYISGHFGVSEDYLYKRVKDTIKRTAAEEYRQRANAARMRSNQQSATHSTEQEAMSATGISQQSQGSISVPSPNAPAAFESPRLAVSEEELTLLIYRHGKSALLFSPESEYYDPEYTSTVADFIRDALEADGHVFENSKYRRLYDEYFRLYDAHPEYTQKDIIDELIISPDRFFADNVSNIMMDKYELTVKDLQASMTVEQTYLVNTVPRAILVYNSFRVEIMEDNLVAKLSELQHSAEANVSAQFEVLKQIQEMARIRKIINERLGRV